jgi:predicted anti-sigma-YlaC factor YlaD
MGMKNECLNEKTLLDILSGGAKLTAEMERHIDGCEQCAELFDRVMARALKVVEREFALTPPVSPHLSDEQMLLFYDHGVTHAESEPIVEHLAACPQCRRSFLRLKKELDNY